MRSIPLAGRKVVHINGLGAGSSGRPLIVDPTGRVLHEARAEELMPIEIDRDVVRRQRERGACSASASR